MKCTFKKLGSSSEAFGCSGTAAWAFLRLRTKHSSSGFEPSIRGIFGEGAAGDAGRRHILRRGELVDPRDPFPCARWIGGHGSRPPAGRAGVGLQPASSCADSCCPVPCSPAGISTASTLPRGPNDDPPAATLRIPGPQRGSRNGSGRLSRPWTTAHDATQGRYARFASAQQAAAPRRPDGRAVSRREDTRGGQGPQLWLDPGGFDGARDCKP